MLIYIHSNGQQSGPFEEADVVERLRSGRLSPDDMGVAAGSNEWQKLGAMFPNADAASSAAPAVNNVVTKSSKAGGGCLKVGLLVLGILLLLVGTMGAVGSRFVPSPSCDMVEQDAAKLKELQAKLPSVKDTPDEAVVSFEIKQTIAGMKASTENCDNYKATWNTVLVVGLSAAFVGLIMAIVGIFIGRRKPAV